MKSLLENYVDTVYTIDAHLNLHPACPLPERTSPHKGENVSDVARIQQTLEAMDKALHCAEESAAHAHERCRETSRPRRAA
jgi:hypothetical protein